MIKFKKKIHFPCAYKIKAVHVQNHVEIESKKNSKKLDNAKENNIKSETAHL